MRSTGFLNLFILGLMIFSCSSENGEDIIAELKFDCSQTDLSLTLQEQIDPTCSTSGSITVLAAKGASPYSYQLDDKTSQTSAVFEGLLAGTYEIIATDNNECVKVLIVTLSSDNGFSATTVATGCGTGDGKIEVTVVEAGTYMYALDNGAPQTSNIFEGLDVGNYAVAVTDDKGCVTTIPETVVGIGLSRDIMPIISANCALPSCHGGNQSPDFTTAANIAAFSNRILSRTTAGTMPPSSPLATTSVNLIKEWVDCGSANN